MMPFERLKRGRLLDNVQEIPVDDRHQGRLCDKDVFEGPVGADDGSYGDRDVTVGMNVPVEPGDVQSIVVGKLGDLVDKALFVRRFIRMQIKG
jgi:hypothetical protein